MKYQANEIHNKIYNPVGKIAKKAVSRSAFLLMLSKIHSYRLLFRRLCPLGNGLENHFRISNNHQAIHPSMQPHTALDNSKIIPKIMASLFIAFFAAFLANRL